MFGPRKPTFTTFLLRLMASFAGGIVGSISIFAIYILGLTISSSEGENPHSLFVILALVFVGSLVTNLISVFLISYFDRESYPRYITILTQAFIIQLVLFLFSIPIYIFVSSLNLGETFIKYIAALHLLLSVQISNLLLETLSNSAYKIVGLYGVTLGSFLTIGIVIVIYLLGLELFLFFIIPPVLWVTIELFRSLSEVAYYYFYKFYGIDALSTETKFEE